MLDINPETVCFLINKAHEFQNKDDTSDSMPQTQSDDEGVTDALADDDSDPTYIEMKSTIDDLEPDQQVALVALMWLGRGDFEIDEWDTGLRQAAESWNPRTAEYLIATPLLGDYLQEGLIQHDYTCEP